MTSNEVVKSGRKKGDPKTDFGRWYAVSGLSISDLIEVLDCSKSHAYELVQGKKIPSLRVAVKLIHMSRAMRRSLKNLKVEDFLPRDPS